jgi:[CysO sulfur-carrier protein]-S-L-cysteine hydrolase
MKRLVFRAGDWVAMSTHAAHCMPEEACGLLAGEGEMVKAIFPVTNRLHSPFRFEMDHKEQLDLFNLIEKSQLEMIGIYHSHPVGPAHPSLTDIDSFSYPGVAYLIWSFATETWTVQGFYFEDGSFSQILLDFPDWSNLNAFRGF